MYKKKSCNFRGSWFLNLKFTRGVTKFCRISRAESLFSLEYLGIKWQTKNSKGVFRKVYLQPPCLDFSWNSPTLTILFEILTIDDMPVDASYMLWFLLKYWEIVEIGPKTDFLANFVNFFVYTPWHLMNYTPIFCQMKDLINIYICGKFCSIAYVVGTLKIFRVSCIDSASMKWPLFGFFCSCSPNYCSILQNFDQSLSIKTNTLLEKSLKVLKFG